MELQGSNIFSNSNRAQFPPAHDLNQVPTINQQQMGGNFGMQPEQGNIGQGHIYNPLANGYQTEDIFATTTNPFIETLRSLALNPNQISTLLSSLPGSGAVQVAQR
jgi:hypothetical protein